MHKVAVLIPAYNEENTIGQVISEVLVHVPQVLVVDDASCDKTVEFVKKYPVTLVQHSVNQGKGASLYTGFRHLISNTILGVITLDGDAQHDPNDLPDFLEKILEQPDALIIGAREKNTKSAPRYRLYANKMADFFMRLIVGRPVKDTQSGYRFYPVRLINQLLSQPNTCQRFSFEAYALIESCKMNLAINYVSIASCYLEKSRPSHFHIVKDTKDLAKLFFKMLFWKKNTS